MAETANVEEAKTILRTEAPGVPVTASDLDMEEALHIIEDERIMARIQAEEKMAIIDMRSTWSVWLLRAIVAITLFDFVVIVAVGLHWFNFSENYIVPIFIGDSFLKTIGLALIVVGFLFNKDTLSKK